MIHNDVVKETDASLSINDLGECYRKMHDLQTTKPHPSPAAPRPNSPLRIAIVGGGCTGLRIATLLSDYAKQQSGKLELEIVLFEAKSVLGGFLQSHCHPTGLVVEGGAQGVLASRTIFLKTLEDIGFKPDDIIAPQKEKKHTGRYILSPSGKIALLTPQPLSLWRNGLLNPLQMLRLLAEFFFTRTPAHQRYNETLYAFFARHFGRACAEHFVLPFVTGIWGGGAEKILLRHAFPRLSEIETNSSSLLRHALLSLFRRKQQPTLKGTELKYVWPKGLLSFPQGMHSLIKKMESHVRLNSQWTHIKLNTPVRSLDKIQNGGLMLNGEFAFDTVFWTTAPWTHPTLTLSETAARLDWHSLQSTPTHDLIVVNISGQRTVKTLDGFGLLAGRHSDGLLGVLCVHSIFQQHVPENHFSYRVLLGGDRNPTMTAWSDERLRAYCIEKLKELDLLTSNTDDLQFEIIRWPRAIGLADIDHDDRLSALWRIEASFPGLIFAGIYKKGVGVADALISAQEAFNAWLSALRPNR